ncbi:helix-turn-helix domain-containing protein [Labrenzia sp. CP4]|jgi:DNA-binding MarR family transcriptional regulator|uniref:helix-turn-helix domain-containing protein n=1 Tax=Labrenzia sp. CP4 TaxID=1674922 RepID=UPI000A759EF5|nr:helix-turn-helix domain-containing protein [Labrenzia sp. CP4]
MTDKNTPTKEKPIYSPVPARAIGDDRLSALDLRVLMVIASHDRLGANKTGCYASHKRLSGLVQCHLKSLSRSLRTLGESGYIEGRPHPLNKKLRVYSVLYTPADREILGSKKAEIGNEAVTQYDEIGNEIATNDNPIGNRDFCEPEQYQEVAEVNILCEAYNISCETVGIHSAETAPIQERDYPIPSKAVTGENPGGTLAILERALVRGEPIDQPKWYEYLETLMSEIDDINDPVYGRAYRLCEEILPFGLAAEA